jgi:hypothetical protein
VVKLWWSVEWQCWGGGTLRGAVSPRSVRGDDLCGKKWKARRKTEDGGHCCVRTAIYLCCRSEQAEPRVVLKFGHEVRNVHSTKFGCVAHVLVLGESHVRINRSLGHVNHGLRGYAV